MHYRKELNEMLESGKDNKDIIKQLYLIRPTCAFSENYEIAEKILSEIADYFNIFISDILVCGSAKLGFSLYKNSDFNPRQSDLDLAIINPIIFTKIFDNILQETRNYSRKNLFKNMETHDKYLAMVQKGMINPAYMPNIPKSRELRNFFSEISKKYSDSFDGVSVCFYLSETAFQSKQYSALNKWKSDYNPQLIGV